MPGRASLMSVSRLCAPPDFGWKMLAAGLLTSVLAGLTACGDNATSPVDLRPPVATIDVTPGTDTLTSVDQTVQMFAVARDSAGAEIPGTIFNWSSTTPSAISVSAAGLAKAVAGGSATIRASAGGKSGEARIDVIQKAVTMEISPSDWSPGWIGARRQFTATAKDANGHAVPGVAFTWGSLDTDVVGVDTLGIATARSAGSTEVAAAFEDLSATAAVSVTDGGSASVPSGLVYTVWFARSDSAPAILVNGSLVIPNGIWDEPTAHTPWAQTNVAKFQWDGDRIGLLTDTIGGTGDFRARDRNGEWTDLVLGTAADFQLEGNRIGVLTGDGTFMAKDGISGPWYTLVAGATKEFQLKGDRIAVLLQDGSLKAKDGLSGAWVTLMAPGSDVKQFELEGNRIGVLSGNGKFAVKDGISGTWTVLADSGADHFELGGSQMAVLFDDGSLEGKQDVNASWVPLVAAGGGIARFDLEGSRLGVLYGNGRFAVKDGVSGTWTELAQSGAVDFQLQKDLIGMLMDDGRLWIKKDPQGAWAKTSAMSGPVSQFRLLVDVPVAPARTTPASYDQNVIDCAANVGGVDCVSPWQVALPAPYYGRFCGAGRPSDAQWSAAVALGPLDAMDALCYHHDNAFGAGWYVNEVDSVGNGATGSCVVRYGIANSKLTMNGVLLTSGTDSQADWDAGWGNYMPRLKSVLDAYWSWTSDCTDQMLADFTAVTASDN